MYTAEKRPYIVRRRSHIKQIVHNLKLIGLGILLVLGLSTVFSTRAQTRVYASASNTLNFQARLLDSAGAIAPDGTYSVQFKLYSAASGGTAEWTETQGSLTVKAGYLSAYLGSVTPFPGTIDWSQQQWLTMNVNGDGEMSPRLLLTAVPNALHSNETDALRSGSNLLTANDLAQIGPSSPQTVNLALAALRLNQTGAGGILQFQHNGVDVFTLANTGDLTSSGSATFSGGSVTLGGASQAGSLVLNDGAGKTGTLQTATLGANRTYTLPDANGTVCLTTTCAGAANGFINGGNSFGGTATLGTNDNFNLNIRTNNTNQLTLDTSGNLNLLNGGLQIGGTTVLTSGRVLQNVTADTSILTSGILGVARGGTGAATFTTNGVIFGNGTGALQATTAGTSGQVLLANGSGVPTFTTLSGDVTVDNAGVTTIGPDAVALGTDTTGNYIAALGTLTGLSASTSSGEGITPTLSVIYGSGANTAAQGNTSLSFTGSGNLTGTVSGTAGGGFTTNTLNVVSNPSFSGLITGSASTTGLALTGAPTNSATASLIQIGSAITGGNVVANGGTYIGLNEPLSGTGSAADFLNFQVNGASKLQVTNAGNIIITGTLQYASGAADTNTLVCRNSLGQLAACSSGSVGGTAFVQGGNNFGGATAGTLGTINNGVLNFITNNTTQLTLDTSGNLNFANGGVQTGGTLRLTNGGALQNITGLTVSSGGANITGGLTLATGALNLTSGGITNAGLIAGATTLSLSGAITGATTGNTINGLVINSGALSSVASLTGSGALTIASGGSGGLTLDSASNTLSIATSDTTLQRIASGVYTVDLNDTADTTLRLINTDGTAVANLNLADGGLQIAGSTILTSGKALQNLTGISTTGGLTFNSFGGSAGILQVNSSGTVSLATAGTTYEVPLTFGNGLTRTVNAVALGGTLSGVTDIATAGNNLTFSGTGLVGIGTASPGFKLDVRNNTSSQIHLTDGTTDVGGYLLGFSTNGLFEAGGAAWNGAAWVAKDTTASQLGQFAGSLSFKADTGLTIGNTFTPTTRFSVSNTGNGTFSGTLAVNGNALTSSSSGFTLLASPTTVTAFGAATTLSLGTASGTTTINGDTLTSTAFTFGGAGSSTVQSASGQNLTVQSLGSGGLTLTSGSGTIGLGSDTVQRSSANLFLDVANGSSNSTLTVSNSGTGVANLSVEGGITAGTNSAFSVNVNGDLTGVSQQLDGSSTANGSSGLGSSTNLTLASASNFDVGNYVQVTSNNCGGTGVNPCYAKITAKATNTLTIAPALTWANGSAVKEYHIPEIGGIDTAQTLANRYGRGYFISGVATGNGTTYYNEDSITTSLANFDLLSTVSGTLNIGTGASTVNIGNSGGTTTIAGSVSFTGNVTAPSSGTSGYLSRSGTTLQPANAGDNFTTSGNISTTGSGTITAAGLLSGLGLNAGSGLIQNSGGITSTGSISLNASASTNTTNIGTGTTSGQITIGGGSTPLVIDSTNFDVSSAGALSGITTIGLSGAISGATATNTINGLVINSGALSAITGFTQTSGNFSFSGSGTFGTGTGAISLNGATTVTGTNTFTVNGGLASLGAGLSVTGDASISSHAFIPGTSGTNAQGYFIGSSGTRLGGLQALDLSGNTYTFFGTNKYFNGTSWVDNGLARVGSSFQIQNDAFTFYSFDTAANFTARFTVASGGNVGIGVTSAPGALLSVGGTTGNFQVSSTGAITAPTSTNTINGLIVNSGSLSGVTGFTQTSGNFAISGTGTFGTGTGAISLNGATTIAANQGLTLASGTGAFAQTFTGTGNAASITANSLTTGAALKVTSSNNTAANTAWAGLQFNVTNAQGTTAVTTGSIFGLDLEFTQNTSVAGNTGSVANFAIKQNDSASTDAVVNSILNLANNDTATGNQVTVTDGLKINGANVTNGIDLSGTFGTNLITATNFSVTQAGALRAGSTINAVSGFQFNGTAGQTFTCGNNQYINAAAVSGGIITGHSACTGVGLSDQRLKKDITPLNDSILSSIGKINTVDFKFDCTNTYWETSNTYCDPTQQTGVLAQQLAQVFPELTYQDSYGIYHVRYDALNIYTLKAVQQLNQKVNNQQAGATNPSGNTSQVSTNGILRLDGAGILQNINGLNMVGGGASVAGGLNNTNGGITNTGAISGATTIDAQKLTLNAQATGNLLELKKDNNGVFTVFSNGALEIKQDADKAFSVKKANNSDVFSVNTSGGLVQIGSTTGDDQAVLLVLDSKNTPNDPAGVNGAEYYNSKINQFRCYQNNQWQDCLPSTFTDYVLSSQPQKWLQPVADQEYPGNPRNWIDLTNVQAYRITMNVIHTGVSSTECRLQYAASDNGPWSDLTTPTTDSPDAGKIDVGAAGTSKTNWYPVNTTARKEVLVRIECAKGNQGTTDSITTVHMQLR